MAAGDGGSWKDPAKKKKREKEFMDTNSSVVIEGRVEGGRGRWKRVYGG